MNFFFLMVCRM
jgi:hypothetical protein